jgi:hypothetical protein
MSVKLACFQTFPAQNAHFALFTISAKTSLTGFRTEHTLAPESSDGLASVGAASHREGPPCCRAVLQFKQELGGMIETRRPGLRQFLC